MGAVFHEPIDRRVEDPAAGFLPEGRPLGERVAARACAQKRASMALTMVSMRVVWGVAFSKRSGATSGPTEIREYSTRTST